MSAILINDVSRTDCGTYFTLTCGKVTMCIAVGKAGYVNTQVQNAAHRAWRGVGKTFWGADAFEQALGAYKSPECKAMIEHARAAVAADALAQRMGPQATAPAA